MDFLAYIFVINIWLISSMKVCHGKSNTTAKSLNNSIEYDNGFKNSTQAKEVVDTSTSSVVPTTQNKTVDITNNGMQVSAANVEELGPCSQRINQTRIKRSTIEDGNTIDTFSSSIDSSQLAITTIGAKESSETVTQSEETSVSITHTTSATTNKENEEKGYHTDHVAMFISFPILTVLAVAGGAFITTWILRKRQVADFQHNHVTNNSSEVSWRVYDVVEKKPMEFMRLKAGARARLVDRPKTSTNHYSEIRVSNTRSVVPTENWYSSVYIDIPPSEESNSDDNYDKINLNTNLKKTKAVNKMRPAYDHVMVEDVVKSPPRKDGYSHIDAPKTENKRTKEAVENKVSFGNNYVKDKFAVCDKEDHEYYVLDPDGNLYIVHECNVTK